MRRAAKTDRNQAEIVKALRAVGCSVQPLHAVGKGCPDILVGVPERSAVHSFFRPRKNLILEIKDGAKSPSERQLTPDQVKWHAAWRGAPVIVVENVDQALEAVK